jgi:hypothetical protein
LVTGGSTNLQIRCTSGSTNSEIYSSAGGAIRISTLSTSDAIRIENGGNIGIGTTTIGSKLQVNGGAAIGYSASTAAPTNGLQVAGTLSMNPTGAGTITMGVTTQYGVIGSGGTNAPAMYFNGATRGGTTPTSASNAVVLALDGNFL